MGFDRRSFPSVPEQVILGFRMLFLPPADECDQRFKPIVLGRYRACERPLAIGFSDVEVERGGSVCQAGPAFRGQASKTMSKKTT
jgi:hypothetical protein